MNGVTAITEVFSWVVERSGQAVLLVIFLCAVRKWIGRWLSARAQYALWLPLIGLLLLPSLPESPVSIYRWLQGVEQWKPVPSRTVIALPVREDFSPPPLDDPVPGLSEVAGSPETVVINWIQWVALGWAALAAGLLGFIGWVNGRFYFRLRVNGRAASAGALRIFDACRGELGIRGKVQLIETDLIDSPATVGVFHPQVLVPRGFSESLDETRIRWIFLHELIHLKRGDLYLNAAMAVFGALHWFNPVLTGAFRLMRADRETACDEAVLERIGREHWQAYGNSLLPWLRGREGKWREFGLVGMSADWREIKSRIERIAGFGRVSRKAAVAGVFLWIGISAVFLTRSPRPDAAPGSKPAPATLARICDRNGVLLEETEFREDGTISAHYPQGALAAPLLTGLDRAVKPKAGEILFLTLDVRAQSILERELRRVGRGAAVWLDPRNGDILAMASVPSFDPNRPFPVSSKTDPLDPRVNRALTAFTPGAAFLPVTALAVAAADPARQSFECLGSLNVGKYVMRCWNSAGHGHLDLPEALKTSCNVYFYQAGIGLGERVAEMARQLGLGQTSGIPVREENSGGIVTPEFVQRHFPQEAWSDGWLANRAIGQGNSQMTPLQMAVMMAAIGNGGTVYWPRLIKRVVRDGETLEQPVARVRTNLLDHGLTSAGLDQVRLGLWKTVNESAGSGRRAAMETWEVAGRTGTAQTWLVLPGAERPQRDTITWFAGFAPFHQPRYAFSVLVLGARAGGLVAAPLAKDILRQLESKAPFVSESLAPANGHLGSLDDFASD